MFKGKKIVILRFIVIYFKYEIYDLKYLIKFVLVFGLLCVY